MLNWHPIAEALFPGYSVRGIDLHFHIDDIETATATVNLDNGDVAEIVRVLKCGQWTASDRIDEDDP